MTNDLVRRLDVLMYDEENLNLKDQKDNKITQWTDFIKVFNA